MHDADNKVSYSRLLAAVFCYSLRPLAVSLFRADAAQRAVEIKRVRYADGRLREQKSLSAIAVIGREPWPLMWRPPLNVIAAPRHRVTAGSQQIVDVSKSTRAILKRAYIIIIMCTHICYDLANGQPNNAMFDNSQTTFCRAAA